MAIFKRAVSQATKPTGLIILGFGMVASAVWPSISESIAKALVNSGAGSNFITKNWELFSFSVDETVSDMQTKIGA
jgi:hypothetical protein